MFKKNDYPYTCKPPKRDLHLETSGAGKFLPMLREITLEAIHHRKMLKHLQCHEVIM